ncbi:MAG: hypothetical protein HY744_24860 [Deltaproteobacteria bacterium]|nr:hypothetical protein [Deltaproteobacteria bacterium]
MPAKGDERQASDARPTVASVLRVLTKDRLIAIGREFRVAIPPAAAKEDQIAALAGSGLLGFGNLLQWLGRDELKAACRAHGLPDDGRARALLAGRLREARGADDDPMPQPLVSRGADPYSPARGSIVQVRQRQYLVEDVAPPPEPGQQTRVELVCLDDDNQGRRLSVLWELELGAKVLQPEARGLGEVARLDPPRHFGAYLHALKWNAVTATDAKLSMWLVTLAKDEPFTFVDHALRHGDSLVGLDFEQIRSFHWQPAKQLELCRKALDAALDEAIALRQQILDLAATSDAGATKDNYRLLRDAEDALEPVRLVGDLVVGAFFAAAKDKDRRKERDRRLALVEAWLRSGGPPPTELVELQAEIRARAPVFHWMTEFPEIFLRSGRTRSTRTR